MQQLKLSQIPKGKNFIFNESEFLVKEVQKDGSVFVSRLRDNHFFMLPPNTDVQAVKQTVSEKIKEVK